MNRTEFGLLMFYCWQLGLKTLTDLQSWKAQHNANTNSQTLQAMTRAYNGREWEEVNGID